MEYKQKVMQLLKNIKVHCPSPNLSCNKLHIFPKYKAILVMQVIFTNIKELTDILE